MAVTLQSGEMSVYIANGDGWMRFERKGFGRGSIDRGEDFRRLPALYRAIFLEGVTQHI
jgi:hypothetical protein